MHQRSLFPVAGRGVHNHACKANRAVTGRSGGADLNKHGVGSFTAWLCAPACSMLFSPLTSPVPGVACSCCLVSGVLALGCY